MTAVPHADTVVPATGGASGDAERDDWALRVGRAVLDAMAADDAAESAHMRRLPHAEWEQAYGAAQEAQARHLAVLAEAWTALGGGRAR